MPFCFSPTLLFRQFHFSSTAELPFLFVAHEKFQPIMAEWKIYGCNSKIHINNKFNLLPHPLATVSPQWIGRLQFSHYVLFFHITYSYKFFAKKKSAFSLDICVCVCDVVYPLNIHVFFFFASQHHCFVNSIYFI